MLQFDENLENLKANKDVSESISILCELALKGDRDDHELFDKFMEYNVISEIFKSLKQQKDLKVINSIISSFAMLTSNIQNNIVYMLSHPYLNEFIIFPYNFNNEETLEYYINFIKSLTLRVTSENMNLFFNQRYNYFPLLVYSQAFYDHQDHMIRITAQNILCQLLRCMQQTPQQQLINKFINTYPFVQIIINYLIQLKETFIEHINSPTSYSEEHIVDILMLFRDIYKATPQLTTTLDNCFLHFTILPAIFNNLHINQQNQQFHIKQPHLRILHLLFRERISDSLLQAITVLLFSKQVCKISILTELKFKVTDDHYLDQQCLSLFVDKIQHAGIAQKLTQHYNYYTKRVSPQDIIIEVQTINLCHSINQTLVSNPPTMSNNLCRQMFLNVYCGIDAFDLNEWTWLIHLIDEHEFSIRKDGLQNSSYCDKLQQLRICSLFETIKLDKMPIKNSYQVASLVTKYINETHKQLFAEYFINEMKLVEQLIMSDTSLFFRNFTKIIESLEFENQISTLVSQNQQVETVVKHLLFIKIGVHMKWMEYMPLVIEQYQKPNDFESELVDGLIKLSNKTILVRNQEYNILNVAIQVIDACTISLTDDVQHITFNNQQDCYQFQTQVSSRVNYAEQETITQIIKYLHHLQEQIKT